MSDKSSSGYIALPLLGVVFVTLKLCGVIHWSWWWVTLPFWGVHTLIAVFFIFIALFLFTGGLISKWSGRGKG